jgi:hypothetical protein
MTTNNTERQTTYLLNERAFQEKLKQHMERVNTLPSASPAFVIELKTFDAESKRHRAAQNALISQMTKEELETDIEIVVARHDKKPDVANT